MTGAAEPNKYRNLWIRAVTGIVLATVAIAALYVGQIAFWALVTLLAIAMMIEWSGLIKIESWKGWLAGATMLAVMFYILPTMRPVDPMALCILLFGVIGLAIVTFSLRLALGLGYIGLACIAMVFLREQGGIALTLWALSTVWATDIGAYFSGKTIGGPKVAPAISPNKTWAGLIGGMVAAAVTGLAFHIWADFPIFVAPLGAGLAIVAQAGDFLESWMKRRAGVKDASNLFPGHGGALDRLDGLLPVAICVGGLSALGWV